MVACLAVRVIGKTNTKFRTALVFLYPRDPCRELARGFERRNVRETVEDAETDLSSFFDTSLRVIAFPR